MSRIKFIFLILLLYCFGLITGYTQTYDKYIWETYYSVNVSTEADKLINKLRTEIDKILAAGHLAPLRFDSSDTKYQGIYLYQEPGRILNTLAMAYPYLTPTQKTAVQNYVRHELSVSAWTPWSSNTNLHPTDGARREYYTMIGMAPTHMWDGDSGIWVTTGAWQWDYWWAMDGSKRPRIHTLYGLWLYAYNSGDWDVVTNNWTAIKNFYNSRSSQGNIYGTMSAHIAMARMAHKMNDTAMRDTAVNNANTNFALPYSTVMNNQETYYTLVGYNYGGGSGRNSIHTAFSFLNIVPEVGRYLKETSARTDVINKNNEGKSKFPFWWLYRTQYFSVWCGEEGVGICPELIGMIFPIERWVVGVSKTVLESYDIMNACCGIGDCYVLESLVHTISAYGTDTWVDIRNPVVATKLVLSATPTSLVANGISSATVTATVCDANNIPVTDSTALIAFSLSGSGTLIGTNPVNAVGGVATITYRSGSSVGSATVTGTSTGLSQGQTTITLIANNPPNAPSNLRCNGQTDPRGINIFIPDLSWTFSDPDSGDSQTGYRILVSSVQTLLNTNIGTSWDTGKVSSSQNLVTYSGLELRPGLTYYWKVMVWDNGDVSSTYSTVASFSMTQTPPAPNNPPNAPSNLLCNNQTNPKGVTGTPTLSWTFSDPDSGNTQSAYRVLVADSITGINGNNGNKWDTNKVVSSANNVLYGGSSLAGGLTYYWKVMVWDNYNSSSTYSTVATFVMSAGVIQEPMIEVSTATLEFGGVEEGQSRTLSFSIRNRGVGTLVGTIGSDQEWIKVDPVNFSGNEVIVNVTVDNSILRQKEGEFRGMVIIESNGGGAEINVVVTATCVLVRPNPYNPNKGLLTFFGDGIVPGETTIKIYTLSGELVRQLRPGTGKEIVWDGKTENGEPISSGIYLYTYESPKEKGISKFTVSIKK